MGVDQRLEQSRKTRGRGARCVAAVAGVVGLVGGFLVAAAAPASAAGVVTANVSFHNFGAVTTYTDNVQSFTLTNTSAAQVALDLDIEGPHSSDFGLLSSGCGDVLAAGATCSQSVNLNPEDNVGSLSATLTVSVDDAAPYDLVSLTASATGPLVSMQPSDQVDLGNVPPGQSKTKVVTVSNAGSSGSSFTLTGNASVQSGQPFTLTDSTCTNAVKIGTGGVPSCQVTVVFSPTETSKVGYAADFSVPTDTGNSEWIGWLLGSSTGVISPSPANWDFGQVTVGQTAVKEIIYTNPGYGPIDVSRDGTGWFPMDEGGTWQEISLDWNSGCLSAETVPLAVGAQCALTVYYKPTVAGKSNVVLYLGNNGYWDSVTDTGRVVVTGTAVSPAASLPPALQSLCPTGSCAGVTVPAGTNLAGTNLAGVDFAGANLSGVNLAGANLAGANLSRATISGADLRNADLRRANLVGAILTNVDLTGADLSGVRTRSVSDRAKKKVKYKDGANLTGAKLNGVKLTKVKATGAIFKNAKLVKVKASKGRFAYANLTKANLSKAKLDKANFDHANLGKANLSKAVAKKAKFNHANLKKANFTKADVKGASFKGADKAGAKGLK